MVSITENQPQPNMGNFPTSLKPQCFFQITGEEAGFFHG